LAGTIIVSDIKTDTDNSFVVRANTGNVLFRVTDTGLDTANSIPSGSITSGMIADGTVIAADVADGSITTAKIADGNVTAAKIADGNVTAAKIDTVANTQVTGTMTTAQVADSAITTDKLADANVTIGKLATTVPLGTKNLIINGAMRIDQRSASVTSSAYTVDRWGYYGNLGSKATVAQSSTAPTGYTNSLLATSSSAYSVAATDIFVLRQYIEGNNIAHLDWGTANAKTVTLSFWVRSSLTGTFGGVLKNAAEDRCYPYSYTISSANTWEQKSITIAGDTTGTWGTGNGSGIQLTFGLGVGTTYSGTAGAWSGTNYLASATGATSVVGTSGATLYITGVQLEVGDAATPFEHRPYDMELARCQRYYYKIKGTGGGCIFATGWNVSTTSASYSITLPVTMRTYPTALETSGTATHYQIVHTNTATGCNGVPTYGGETSPEMARVDTTVASGLTAGQGSGIRAGNIAAYLAWSAEL